MAFDRRTFLKVGLLAATQAAQRASFAAPALEYFVYIGTYTDKGKSKGIELFRFNGATGKLTAAGLAGEETNPSYVTLDAAGRHLYAASEVGNFNGQKAGAVSAFSIDRATGKLTKLNTVSSRGSGPCFVKLDGTGKVALVANYGAGSVAALPVLADGKLGEAVGFDQHMGKGPTSRQSGPHAHSANFSPDNRFVIVADLGLDKLFVYRLDPAKASITLNDPPAFSTAPGAGPRHFAFHPNGKFAYVINELNSTVTAMNWDAARGVFTELASVSTLPAGFTGSSSTAEVQVHPNGKFLYGSNRGHDSIATFSIALDGRLTLVGHTPTEGKVPRNFAIDPTGKWIIAANQNTDNIAVFAIDKASGRLTFTGQSLAAGSPVCVKFLAAN